MHCLNNIASSNVLMVEIWCLMLPSTYAFVIALKANQKYTLGFAFDCAMEVVSNTCFIIEI